MSAFSDRFNSIVVEKEAKTPILPAELFYPESDGKPMAETDIHRDLMVDIILALQDFYRDVADVYVSGNLLMYYTEGVLTDSVAPDIFVVKGVQKRRRRIYKIWEEGKAPDVIIELTSKSTRMEDMQKKKKLYESLQVSEYFLFDPLREYLRPALRGYRLFEGRYEPITPFEGRLRSFALNMDLVHQREKLQLIDLRTGERLLTPLEQAEAKRRAEAERDEMAEKWRQEVSARKSLEAELVRLRQQLKT
jgi:Uma2 family endonuclease